MRKAITQAKHFPRPELANFYVDFLFDDPSAASGVFISAPRRTGKSTFLQRDLIPALENNDAKVIYVDLWQDKELSPQEAVRRAMYAALEREKSIVGKILKRFGKLTAKIGHEGTGAEVSIEAAVKETGASISDLVDVYTEHTNRLLVLIVDEAQHASTTPEGVNMLFALKAARDRINLSADDRAMRIVFTGSDRDRLAMLRNHKEQPFFGAPVVGAFPLLGLDFVQWFCETEAAPIIPGLDPDDVYKAFEAGGNRPEQLRAALSEVRLDLSLSDEDKPAAFFQSMYRQMESVRESMESVVSNLTPIQAAVLEVMVVRDDLAPFSKDALQLYEEVMNRDHPEYPSKMSVPAVQQALNAMRAKGLFSRFERGVYELEDAQSLRELFGVANPGRDRPKG